MRRPGFRIVIALLDFRSIFFTISFFSDLSDKILSGDSLSADLLHPQVKIANIVHNTKKIIILAVLIIQISRVADSFS